MRHCGQCAVSDRALQDAVSAVTDAEQIKPLHSRQEAEIAENGKPVFLHARRLVHCHFLRGTAFGLRLSRIGTHQHLCAEAFLQKDPEGTVPLLYALVQRLHPAAEEKGQNQQHGAGRQQHRSKPRIQYEQHDRRTDQLDRHAGNPRQNVRKMVGDNRAVIGQAVEPFAGMHRTDRRVIAGEYLVQQPCLQHIFHGGTSQLLRVPDRRVQQNLYGNEKYRQQRRKTETRGIARDSGIHDIPQQQRIQHARSAEEALHHRQQRQISFFASGDAPEPPDGILPPHVVPLLPNRRRSPLPARRRIARNGRTAQISRA